MSVLSLIPEDKKKDSRKESLESVYSSNSRLNLLTKRKRLSPLEMLTQGIKGDRYVAQRVLSAKTHRVKQLQNQLADAHFHLQELSNENRVLRALQKKQDIALQRYENSNAELPTILNSHTEEMRIQQSKFKLLKQQYKDVTQRLKEKDMQYQQLKDEHMHLLELSKDRNLLDRERLQAQVVDLTATVQQQNDTISNLQRRLTLEAKNFKHQLQTEINKHKDTRHDLDLAISNADKLTTIIEMKEKMISTNAGRNVRSPNKAASVTNIARPVSKTYKPDKSERDTYSSKSTEERNERSSNLDQLSKLCENSRNVSSALARDEEICSSIEPRSRYVRSRINSIDSRSTLQSRKNSKGSDDMIELAKTVQDGMADLAIFDDETSKFSYQRHPPDDVKKRIEAMKADLLSKIKNDGPRKSSALIKQSTEESVEEEIVEEEERPKSRGRRSSSVSFYNDITVEETTTTTTVAINDYRNDEVESVKPKRENSTLERKLSGKSVDKHCKDMMQDIEKSSKVIDKHMINFNNSVFDSDKIVKQLEAVDKINELVNTNGEIPSETLTELNNNFQILTDQVFGDVPVARKRSIAGRRNSKEIRNNLLGDSAMSNQEMLNDLLGRN